MEKYFAFILAIGAAIVIVSGILAVCQLFLLVKTDAKCRGLNCPTFWGVVASGGNNQSGLIMYLIIRRKFPIVSMTEEQKSFMERCKKKIKVGIIFLIIGAMACIWGIVLI